MIETLLTPLECFCADEMRAKLVAHGVRIYPLALGAAYRALGFVPAGGTIWVRGHA